MRLTALYPPVEIDVVQRDKAVTKKEKVRFIFNPMCYLRRTQSREPYLDQSSIGDYWKKMLVKAGVRHRRFHQARHTYACWTLAATGNIVFVADQMGHTDFAMLTKIYARWMPSNSRREAERIWSVIKESYSSEGT